MTKEVDFNDKEVDFNDKAITRWNWIDFTKCERKAPKFIYGDIS